MKKLMVLATAFLCIAGTQVLAADSDSKTKKDAVVDTKETREQMAAHHDKMAQCLRSDKSLDTCRDEMHAECENMPGEHACMMMHKKGKGKMRSR